eukprot:5683542-Pleurochrysis_carterae.AAC.1
MCSNASWMNFHVSRPATVNGLFRSKSKTGSGVAVQLDQNAPSRCSKRRAKFQWSAGLGRGAICQPVVSG